MAEALTKTQETVLVVDDIKMVRELVVEILQSAHFKVLHADSGANALKLAADYTGTIDLLLSDVQMPGTTGPDLGEALKKARPDMHVMFMSGFAGGNLLVLNYGWAFIEKPFVPAKLVEMVNVVLHTPNKSQGSSQYDARRDVGKPETGQTRKGSK